MKSRLTTLSTIVIPLLLLAAMPVLAQQVASNLTGLVTDQEGNPLAGVPVEIVHVPTGSVRFAETRASGRYSVQGLRTGGPYRITAYREGFEPVVVEDVRLRLGETETVNIEVIDRADLERVVVTGTVLSQVFQPDNMGTGSTISADRMDNFTSISRSINDYIRLDPRATVIDKGRNEISVGGGHNRFNNIQIDGVTANDSFGLEADAQPAVRQPIAIDWLEEISVSISPYDVTQTGGTGAIVNSVTKSGTNEFSGRVYGNYRDENFVGDDEGGRDFPDFEEWTAGAYIGGPIIQDNLFFFVGWDRSRQDDVSAVLTGPIGSGRPTIFNSRPEDIDQVINIAQNVWGFNAGDASSPRSITEQTNWIAKVDWDISDRHRASLRYSLSEGTRSNFNRNQNFFDLSSRFFDQNIDYESWTLQAFSDWTPNFSTEFRATITDFESRFDIGELRPQVSVEIPAVDVTTGNPAGTNVLRFGTEQFRHANELDVTTTQIFLKGNYFTGLHSIDFGFDWQEEDYKNLFVESSAGVWDFDSIGDFATGNTGVRYTLRTSADPNDPLFPRAEFAWDVLGLFVQDNWSVTSNLNLQFGIRWEFFNTDDDPLRNEAFEQAFGFSNQGTLDGEDVFQPRFGFNWQPGQLDFRGQLRGGVGLFRGRNPGVWITNPFTNPGGTIDVFTCDSRFDANECLELDPNFNFTPDPNNQPRLGAISPAQDVDVVEDGFRLPTEWKANLAWDMELPGIDRSNLTVEVAKTWVEDSMFWTDENLGAVQGQLPDGRDHFWANPNAASGARSARNRDFNNVIVMRNTGKGERTNATISLDKTWLGDWGTLFGRVAYNYMSASDVSSGTSSRAISSFRNQPVFNTNEEVSGRSIFEIGDSVNLLLQYTANWAPFGSTRFSTFFQHRDGRRFSWVFDGDMNGDGVFNNNLLFVPNFGEVRFVDFAGNPDPAGEAAFFELVENVGSLRDNQGGVVQKNSDRSSSVTQMDVRIAQDFDFGRRFRGQLFFDIENFTNLLNSSWGAIDQVPFNWTARPVRFRGIDEDTGQMLYQWMGRGTNAGDFEQRQDGIGESRWRAQIGLRFEF